jgi:GTP-binding protein LepA
MESIKPEIYNQSKIRNFSIIAHIDHGKSTLADRILQLCGKDFSREKHKDRIMDTLEIEQEKGITIKLQAAKMYWKGYELNLIDTPGHVDFSYEVSRSLAACESALLLIDAQQGIQAQTISNTRKALEQGLEIIPVINKIDLPGVNMKQRLEEIHSILGFKEEDVIKVSAKTGEGVDLLLDRLVERTPAPTGDMDKNLKALIFDSFYDDHRGVVVAIRVFEGKMERQPGFGHEYKELFILQKQTSFKPTEIGIFSPELKSIERLCAGEVGYIATGLKDIRNFTVGDTISDDKTTEAWPGYQAPKPNVYATFFPTEVNDYVKLKEGLDKLCLNDAALTYTIQKSNMLGSGFRCGFLGLLHMEIVQERLEREYDIDLVITAPTVEYKILRTNGVLETIQTAHELPDPSLLKEIREPWVRVELMTPQQFIGPLMSLCQLKRGNYVNTKYLNAVVDATSIIEQYVVLEYDMPLASLITNFFDQMKNLSRGYASMEYEFIDFFPVDLVKVSILVNFKEVFVLDFLETRENARTVATKVLEVMKDVIPRQQFEVPLQAAINSKVIARENVRAAGKDVLSKLYGGDYSRKLKVLERQKKGKKRLKEIGKVSIPQDAFLAILKT